MTRSIIYAAAPVALAIGFGTPSVSHAQSDKSPKTQTQVEASKKQSNDDFEENRRLHMRKSKENNDKKGSE